MSFPLKEPGLFMGPRGRETVLGGSTFATSANRRLLRQGMLRGYAGERHFGESSTYYTMGTRARRWRIPERMHRLNANLRFVYVVRDPLARIYSNYLHALRRGSISEGFQKFLMHREGKSAVLTSCYFRQIGHYLEFFPRDRFHITVMEELLEQPQVEMQKACEHLGIEYCSTPKTFPSLNASPKQDADDLSRSVDALPDSIRDTLREDARQLGALLGRHISAWRKI